MTQPPRRKNHRQACFHEEGKLGRKRYTRFRVRIGPVGPATVTLPRHTGDPSWTTLTPKPPRQIGSEDMRTPVIRVLPPHASIPAKPDV